MSPEGLAQFEYHKMQLMGNLTQIASNLRDCAAAAEQFSQIIGSFPYNGNSTGFAPLANGQFPMPVVPPMPIHEETGKKRKSRTDDPDGKRKAKKLKDPNAPKRPPSSYLLFQNDVRNELKAKNPTLSNNELLGAISKLWAEMPQEQKDAYEARNKLAKDEWLAQKAIYESGKVAGTSLVPVPVPPVPPMPVKVAASSPVVAETSTSEESSEEDEDASSGHSSDVEEQRVQQAVSKKSKKELVALVKEEGKKEKKHKKSKA